MRRALEVVLRAAATGALPLAELAVDSCALVELAAQLRRVRPRYGETQTGQRIDAWLELYTEPEMPCGADAEDKAEAAAFEGNDTGGAPQEVPAAGILPGVGGRELSALAAAIRVFTIEAPNGAPNGDAERAMERVAELLGRDWSPSTRAALVEAARDLFGALARDTRALRVAAEGVFGGDFRRYEDGGAS